MHCIVHGVPKSWTGLSNFHFHFHYALGRNCTLNLGGAVNYFLLAYSCFTTIDSAAVLDYTAQKNESTIHILIHISFPFQTSFHSGHHRTAGGVSSAIQYGLISCLSYTQY